MIARAALLVPVAAAGLALGGCGLEMSRQPKYGAQAQAPTLPGGFEQQGAPPGTVAQGDLQRAAAEADPPPVTLALVQRGRDRFDIACRPCHGDAGEGDGTVPARGFPRPPSYLSPQVMALSGRQVYGVITNGYGLMYPQAERVAPADRWAVVAYVRALQLRGRVAGGGPSAEAAR